MPENNSTQHSIFDVLFLPTFCMCCASFNTHENSYVSLEDIRASAHGVSTFLNFSSVGFLVRFD